MSKKSTITLIVFALLTQFAAANCVSSGLIEAQSTVVAIVKSVGFLAILTALVATVWLIGLLFDEYDRQQKTKEQGNARTKTAV